MTPLWLAAVAMLMLALALLVPALFRSRSTPADARQDLLRRLYHDQLAELARDSHASTLAPEDHVQAVDELQRQLLEAARRSSAPPVSKEPAWTGWAVALALSLALPTAALLLYLQVGNPHAFAMQVLAAGKAPSHAEGADGPEGMVTQLATRLRTQPGDLQGWVVLARSYEVLERFDDAAAAWEKAIALAPDEPQFRADFADAWASAHEGDLRGPAQAAIDAALALDPDHPKALALAGMAAYRQADRALARKHWEHLRSLLPAGSEAAAQVEANLATLQGDVPGTKAGSPASAGSAMSP